jgi:hypothetical protein
MRSKLVPCLAVAALVAALGAAPAAAGEVEKTVPFALDQWWDLGVTDGPLTLHRIRITREGRGVKSKIMRPGNSEYLEDIQIQLEFTNDATKDWEARVDLEWSDAQDNPIDGYNDRETLDSESRHEDQTVTLSTLRYGLDRAKKLAIRIEFQPD